MPKDIFEQGERYEEEPADIMDDSPKRIQLPNKKLLIIGGAIFLVMLVFVLFPRGNKESAEPKQVEAEEPIIEVFKLNSMEVADLRAAGYIADEIEKITSHEEAESLITSAEKSRQDYLNSQYEKFMNSASEEYKQLLNNTWLGGKDVEVHSENPSAYETKICKENVDYVKLPARGQQLYIKLTLEDGTTLFNIIHPSRYEQLREEGNMVIEYEKITYGEGTFITVIKEVRP